MLPRLINPPLDVVTEMLYDVAGAQKTEPNCCEVIFNALEPSKAFMSVGVLLHEAVPVLKSTVSLFPGLVTVMSVTLPHEDMALLFSAITLIFSHVS
jgi:hypothetical protein